MKKKKNSFKKILISLLILIVIFILGSYYFIRSSLNPVSPKSEEVIEVEIPMGSNKNEIANILEEKKLIKNPLVYNLYLRLNNKNNFQAGTYLMSPSMSLEEIVEYLNEGDTPIVEKPIARLTIAEGLDIEQIGKKIEEKTDFTSKEFMRLIQSEKLIKKMAEKYPDLLSGALENSSETRYTLEGYLYPATYDIYEDTDLENLIKNMIGELDQLLSSHYDEIEKNELSLHELLTLASYIEGEGVSDDDRELISGVFYNRLEEDMLLRTDPSVSYALGEHKKRISHTDLEVDSPYNTYKYSGISPGPINNPSMSAIKASIYPAETDYLYFLADLETKKVYFSKNYEQHLEYKSKYLDNNE